MTGTGKHRSLGDNSNAVSGVFIVMGTLLSISISLNAVFYVFLTWNLVPN